jgi:MoaA/NifB/PqqE/SkfB family radical SAM enzyme
MGTFIPAQSLKVLGKWSANRILGKRQPIVAVLGLTHYCNYYCPMCPYGDSNKEGQLLLEKKYGLSTEQWKIIFDKVSERCLFCILEGGEPTSRPDFMELVKYAHSKMPVFLITNGSLLHTVDLEELKKYIMFVTCSIDSVFEESYCKVRGVPPEVFRRVMQNLYLLKDHKMPRNFNSTITKYNTEEFITQSYFDKAREELEIPSVTLTFAEDRFDVNYSSLPDKKTIAQVCDGVLDHMKSGKRPKVMIPPLYFEQLREDGQVHFEECGVWKSVFVNPDGTVMVPCWKFRSPENIYSLLEKSIDEIWQAPQWEIAKTCHDCKVLCCVWSSSQPATRVGTHYIRTMLSNIIT